MKTREEWRLQWLPRKKGESHSDVYNRAATQLYELEQKAKQAEDNLLAVTPKIDLFYLKYYITILEKIALMAENYIERHTTLNHNKLADALNELDKLQ